MKKNATRKGVLYVLVGGEEEVGSGRQEVIYPPGKLFSCKLKTK